MTNLELKNGIKNNLFSCRDTLDEAYDYADMVARASGNQAAFWTALQVVLNTVSNHIKE